MQQLDSSEDLMSAYYQMFREEPQQPDCANIMDSSPSPRGGNAALDDDLDCHFDITDGQSYEGSPQPSSLPQRADESEWDMEPQSQPPPEPAQHPSFDSLKEINEALTCLDRRMQSVIDQLKKQNRWNGTMQNHIATMAQGYDDIAALKAGMKELQGRGNSLFGDEEPEESVEKPTVGRQKRAAR